MENTNDMQFTVSTHAAERYAKRIGDREAAKDVTIYATVNREKITTDINKMIQFSDLIYSGRVGSRDKSPVNVYLSGTWVILTDIQNKVVITIYKIDFNLGEEFNKQFISATIKKMNKHKKELEDKKAENDTLKESYLAIMEEYNAQILELKSQIAELEKLNKDYSDVVKDIDATLRQAETAIRKDVEDLIMKKEF